MAERVIQKNRLQSKDLIIAGAFAALYIVLMFASVSVMGMMPLTYLCAPLFLAIILGPVYMLYVSKIPKRGAIFILSVMVALLTSMGGVWQSAVWCLLCGLVGELLAGAGAYRSKRSFLFSYIVFACTNMGPYWLLVFAKNSFLEMCTVYYGTEYAATIDAFTPFWIIFVLIGFALVGGLIGGLFGQKLLEKHFKKAGVV